MGSRRLRSGNTQSDNEDFSQNENNDVINVDPTSRPENNDLVNIVNQCMEKALKNLNDDLISKLQTYIDGKLSPLQEDISKLRKDLASLKKCHEETGTTTYSSADEMPMRERLAEKRVAQLTVECDTLEQYTRRNSVRLFNVRPRDGENTTEVACEIFNTLGVQCTVNDIDVSHRVKSKETTAGNKPDAIIVKLVRREIKSEIMKKKKSLKGTRFNAVRIEEDLTAMRKRLMEVLRYKATNRYVWSRDGVIFAKEVDADGNELRSTKVRNFEDLYNLELEYSKWYYVVGRIY